MKTSCLKAFIALVAGVIIGSGSSSAQSQDPAWFFGGSNNDAYAEWLQHVSYERTVFLPSPTGNETGAALHWTIKDDQIYLAMAAKAKGWISFGIAESGGMFGADIVTYMAPTQSLVDGYIEDERMVVTDDCQSWTLVDAIDDGGFLIFEAVRALDTGDTQDRPIVEDGAPGSVASRIIVAWSDSPALNAHGPNNRASTTLRFHGTQEGDNFELAMMNEAEGFIELTAQDHIIKPIDTEYGYFCFSYADMIAQGLPENVELHAIGFDPIIDPRSAKHVHHFTLQAATEGNATAGSNCSDIAYLDIAYLWAPGDGALALPSNLGGPLGENGFKSFQLEIHYNNPWLKQGVLDSSGIRIYYTRDKREHDIGVLALGDPSVALSNVSVGDGLAAHKFDCPGSCSGTTLNEKVTVVREFLHMHQTGLAMSNHQVRDGEVIHVGKVEYYDFSQQGAYTVKQPPFEVLMYYPRTVRPSPYGFDLPFVCGYRLPLPDCDSGWEQTKLESRSELNRTFGSSSGTCPGEATSGAYLLASRAASIIVCAVIALLSGSVY